MLIGLLHSFPPPQPLPGGQCQEALCSKDSTFSAIGELFGEVTSFLTESETASMTMVSHEWNALAKTLLLTDHRRVESFSILLSKSLGIETNIVPWTPSEKVLSPCQFREEKSNALHYADQLSHRLRNTEEEKLAKIAYLFDERGLKALFKRQCTLAAVYRKIEAKPVNDNGSWGREICKTLYSLKAWSALRIFAITHLPNRSRKSALALLVKGFSEEKRFDRAVETLQHIPRETVAFKRAAKHLSRHKKTQEKRMLIGLLHAFPQPFKEEKVDALHCADRLPHRLRNIADLLDKEHRPLLERKRALEKSYKVKAENDNGNRGQEICSILYLLKVQNVKAAKTNNSLWSTAI